ncbi:MAG: hypothetical protein EKK63_14375, partial [Acinetobacter sp.]|uniref:hypothetical protein n=1 Tax=Acinetobacter sp. TaxID=472 RepID=UPI000FBF0639
MPSKVDPNVYAMSIQLSLESSDAFTSLDAFSKQVSDLETELSNAARKSMLSLGQVSAEATKGVESINAAFMKTEGITVKIHTNLEAATKEINDQFDKGEEQLENVEETHKLMVKMQKIQLNMGKELGKHLKINDAFLDGTEKIVDAVHRKNIGHQEQNKLLANDVAEAKRMAGEIGGVTDEVKEAEKAWIQVKTAMKQVWGLIKQIDADTEKFVTTNYRAYGSQQQLVQGARNLAMEHQVSYENAVAAYQVLGNLKVPRDEMDKYAKVVGIANRTTGVGVQQVGEYVNRLRLAGFSAQQAERSVAHMTEAMRKFGLNTHDVNALMNQSAANAKSAARNFGGGAEELKKWEESRVTMAAFARTAGHSAEELAGFENWILNDVAAMELFKAQTNTTETGIDGFRLAMLRAGLETNKQMEEIEAGIRNGTRDVSERIAMEQTLIKTYYGGNRAAYESARAMGKAAKEAGVLGDKVEDLDKISGIAANTMENQLGEANNTLTGQLKILGSTVWSVLGSVLQLAADAIMPLVKALNW